MMVKRRKNWSVVLYVVVNDNYMRIWYMNYCKLKNHVIQVKILAHIHSGCIVGNTIIEPQLLLLILTKGRVCRIFT